MSEETSEKRLTVAEWTEATTLYELGEASLSDLSRRFGISTSAISQHFKKHGIVKGAKKAEVTERVTEAVTTRVVDEAATFAAQRKKRIEETKQHAYQSMAMMHMLAHKSIVDAQKAGKPLSSTFGELKAIRLATSIIATTRQERYDLLEADKDIDENALPVLTIRDLTLEEIDMLKSVDTEDEDLAEGDINLDDDIIVEDD